MLLYNERFAQLCLLIGTVSQISDMAHICFFNIPDLQA